MKKIILFLSACIVFSFINTQLFANFIGNNNSIDISDTLPKKDKNNNGAKADIACAISHTPPTMPILEGQCVDFFNSSNGADITWTWSFPGSTSPNSNVQNPQNVCYFSAGTYPVSLTVSTADTTCSITLPAAIIVEPDPEAPIVDFHATQVVVQVGGAVNFVNTSQNGPFGQWAWEFEGGNPNTSVLETPPPITYDSIGTFDVVLRGQKEETGVQKIKVLRDYIKVVAPPNNAPTANFVANNLIIHPGESVNFIDMTLGDPFTWEWTFTGANPATSNEQNPQNITYNNTGCFAVKLTASNSVGSDVIEKTCYINVTNTDPCTQKPEANFTTRERLIPFGKCVNFENTTTGGTPLYTQWTFQGGSYNSNTNIVEEFNPSQPICYETPGIYDVTLFVANNCGSSSITKEKYIYVFSGDISYYCEEQSPRESGESYFANKNPNGYGYIIGHSSKNYRYFANYFDSWTFNQIKDIILPIDSIRAVSYNAYITLCIWEENGNQPAETPIYTQKVYLRNLVAKQNNSISLTTPVDIDGPFYAGFKINYVDNDPDDGISDDIIGGYIINKGGYAPNNKLFFKKNDNASWETANDLLGYSAAMMIKTNSCLVDVEDFIVKENNITIYPNPSNSIINIQLDDNFIGNINFEIMDITGKIYSVKEIKNTDSEYTMNLSNLPTGLYILKIQNNKTIITKKIILTK